MRINDVLRAGHVKRWHTVHVLREQSIAEHMWNVAMIADTIFLKLGLNVDVYTAMTHDLSEVRGGDIPSHQKSAAPYSSFSDEQIVIKGADLIDAEWFMLNYRGPGSHAQEVFKDVQQRLDNFIIDCPENIGEAVMKVRAEVMDPRHEL